MMMLANIGSPSQWFILILLCLLIFGAKRLPDIARALGRSLGEFRKARREFEEELMRSEAQESTRPACPVPLANESAPKDGAALPSVPGAQASGSSQAEAGAAGTGSAAVSGAGASAQGAAAGGSAASEAPKG
ncbi:MAG TPA: twin-arginine translocase TatA/TatE family subunit [Candidatus Akkermansia intestinavium]|nr:twin-arginine translocase TatA/TatE family subunit [Candidatus Akkermansia intestinavium]